MADPLRVLCVQDTDRDPLLLIDELERGGYEPLWRRVDSIEDLDVARVVGRFFLVANAEAEGGAYPNVTRTEGRNGEGFYEAVIQTLAER